MKWGRKFRSERFVLLAALLFSCVLYPSGPAQAWDVFSSSPWLAVITRFIGGVYVSVKPVQEWNSEGETVRKIRPRDIPRGAKIIALDEAEASALGLQNETGMKTFSPVQYCPLLTGKKLISFFLTLRVLPLLAQRILTGAFR